MKRNLPILSLTLILSLGGTSASATLVDGSTENLAAYSAKQLLENALAFSDGMYWMDEQMGLGFPFVACADMTTDGGGWTLGIVSLDADPLASFSILANTGTVSAPFGSSYSRAVSYLGLEQDAEFHYLIRSGGTTIFDGIYSGRFDDSTPTFTTSIDTFGLNGVLDSTYDFHRADRNYDVAVLLRESSTPTPRDVVANTPEPETILLLAVGLIGAAAQRVGRRGATQH
ncbi:MAG: PEP-CTERM sorting domain-containing protein [Thiohalocapsa sp.]|uniref:fibrinogen-like YCDxxxxGGGW domain-containing protein n=1 Tax=Thiohalocapsa sp. TaxID=2497641 RepID=UPI0025DD62CF|nr:fibrinogen-like YCDxxxxGGGW domain-containing protein [Thiohalocapsa sp.]MCG6942824.1 PEP-CTERM sorting domain-containing protein [Thiohalocapsa sp.]